MAVVQFVLLLGGVKWFEKIVGLYLQIHIELMASFDLTPSTCACVENVILCDAWCLGFEQLSVDVIDRPIFNNFRDL